MRSRSLGALVVALVVAACSGSSSATSAPSPTTTTAGGGTTTTLAVGAAEGAFTTSLGVGVEMLAGSFPDGTGLTVESSATPDLPPGAEAVGPSYRITATAEPAIPVALAIPIPPGTPADDLFLLRVPDEGEPQIIGGTIEGDTYVAAVPGFSTFLIVTWQLKQALSAYGRVFTGPGFPPSEQEDGLTDEFSALISGDLAQPAARAVRVVGPTEIPLDRGASYGAIDFSGLLPRFYEYSWTVYGPLEIQGPADTARLVVEPNGSGRALVTVDVTDPVLGVSAFASQRVFVLESGDPGLYLSPDQDAYEIGDHAQVLAAPRDMTPPYSFEWSTSGGEDGFEDGLDGAATIDVPLAGDTVLTVTVTDSADTTVTQALGIHVHETSDRCPLIALAGPHIVSVGESTTFRILTSAELPGPPEIVVFPAATFQQTDDTLTVMFSEPGRGIIWFRGSNSECGALMGAGFVGVEGPAPDVAVRFADVPTDAAVGETVTVGVEAMGGVVSTADGIAPYTGTIDWGDGTVDDLVIDATAASTWNPTNVEHTYEEAGDFTIAVAIESPDGGTADAMAMVTVADSNGRHVGDVVEFRDADTETFIVTKNKAVLVVGDGTIEWRRLDVAWHNLYETFDLQGHTTIADCDGTGGYQLTSADLTLNAKGKIKGTAVLAWSQHDTGPDCPFGGQNSDRVVTGTVTGSVDGSTLTLTYDGMSDDGHPVTMTIEASAG